MTEEFKSQANKPTNEQMQVFVKLLTIHQARIRGYILSLVPNFNDAEDIMQETSRTMWDQFSDFEPGSRGPESGQHASMVVRCLWIGL